MDSYKIDTTSDPMYYIILRDDGTEFCKVSKSSNGEDRLKNVMQYFNIKECD